MSSHQPHAEMFVSARAHARAICVRVDGIIYGYRYTRSNAATRGYTRGFCRGAITRDTMEYIGCKPINPPTLFWLFLSLLDLQTVLLLLRTETAVPPTVANTFDGDESDEGSER